MSAPNPPDPATLFFQGFVQFQEQIERAVQNAAAAMQEHIERGAAIGREISKAYERYQNEIEPAVIKVFTQAGWVGLERHITMQQALTLLQIYQTNGEEAMNDAIHGLLNRSDAAQLAEMVEVWLTVPYLKDREPVFRDALQAHRSGQATLTIPALLPLAEGLCAEIYGRRHKRAPQHVAQTLRSAGDEWIEIVGNFMQDVVYLDVPFGADPGPLSRHGVLHGWVTKYWTPHNSTRVFLLVDAMADTWLAKQKASSPKAS